MTTLVVTLKEGEKGRPRVPFTSDHAERSSPFKDSNDEISMRTLRVKSKNFIERSRS